MIRTALVASFAFACFAPLPLFAAAASIAMPINAIETYAGASIVHSVISLPNTGTPGFATEFVLPPDHKPDTPVKLKLHLSVASAACAMRLEVQQSARTRPGKQQFNSAERIVVLNSATAAIPGNGVVAVKTVEIRKPATAPFKGLKASDGFHIRLARDSANGEDSCGSNVLVNHVELRYTRK
jgi:hypothetical protein